MFEFTEAERAYLTETRAITTYLAQNIFSQLRSG